MTRSGVSRPLGLSLLECLMAVSILGILMVLAVPLQTAVTQRLQRGQGRTALAQASWWMERQAALLGNYPTVLPDSAWWQDGLHYTLSLSSTQTSYVLTAQPQGAQALDACGSLWLNNLGQRGASGSDKSCCLFGSVATGLADNPQHVATRPVHCPDAARPGTGRTSHVLDIAQPSGGLRDL